VLLVPVDAREFLNDVHATYKKALEAELMVFERVAAIHRTEN
jgi:hypothetical protein